MNLKPDKNGKVGHGVPFERIRRVTGYLAPTARFTAAKKAELKDRVKHLDEKGACYGVPES